MSKTPDYTKKAVNNYRNKFDLVQVRFPKGTKEQLKTAGIENINEFIVNCVLDAINRAEEQQAAAQAPEMPAEPSKASNRDYLPLTPENIAKVDLDALACRDQAYSAEVFKLFGMDGLNKLVELAEEKKSRG